MNESLRRLYFLFFFVFGFDERCFASLFGVVVYLFVETAREKEIGVGILQLPSFALSFFLYFLC